MTMPMLICRSITSPSTIATTRDRRPLKPTIIGNVPRRDNWTTCSGWRKNECSVKTGWCVTKTACCNSRGKIVTGRRLRAECWCGRTSQDTSSFTIADRACRFAKFPWLLLREEQRKGRCPFPCNPIPETYGCGRQASSLSCRGSSLETRLAEYENSCLLSRMVTRGHFYCGQTGDIPNVV